ncbi:unnamed protein product [Pleuronectes platessa]|uniref:Uncharacterized protein n=1 Tax=Pleuronectes platessa TaxID=8262 RepID=A0A9N7W3J4_PLEPL|nr:unnamed protein product [Pleuronectes platessa]
MEKEKWCSDVKNHTETENQVPLCGDKGLYRGDTEPEAGEAAAADRPGASSERTHTAELLRSNVRCSSWRRNLHPEEEWREREREGGDTASFCGSSSKRPPPLPPPPLHSSTSHRFSPSPSSLHPNASLKTCVPTINIYVCPARD